MEFILRQFILATRVLLKGVGAATVSEYSHDMAAIYRNNWQFTQITVGITDLSRCTDRNRINSMIRYLRGHKGCDLIILSNTSYEELEPHTDLLQHLEPGACTYKTTTVNRRCIPFNQTTTGAYIFTDAFIKQPCGERSGERIDVTEIWEQLRVRPFIQGEMMEDNLGGAPGILKSGEDGDWELTSKFGFGDIENWFHK